MVDELRTIREARSGAELRRAYALWMAEHTDAQAWELRWARDAFHKRRERLHLLRVDLPETVAAPEAVTAWLSDWAEPRASNESLQQRLADLGDDLERGRGRGSYEALLAAREQWLLLLRKPGLPKALLAILQRRITTPDPAAREIEWAAGSEARALARTIRDGYPLVYECERAFFRPHLAPPALRSDLRSAKQRKRLTGSGFRTVWAFVLVVVALNSFARLSRSCSGDRAVPPRLDTSATDRILERARNVLEGNELELDETVREERTATLRFATRTDTTEDDILEHFARYGHTEAWLRAAVGGNDPEARIQDRSLRMFYKALLARLDGLRAGRGRK